MKVKIKQVQSLETRLRGNTPTNVPNSSGTYAIDLNDNVNFKIEATGSYNITVTVASDNVAQAGTIIINNTSSTTPAVLPSNCLTPNGENISWDTATGSISIISYYVFNTTQVLVNYVGNFS